MKNSIRKNLYIKLPLIVLGILIVALFLSRDSNIDKANAVAAFISFSTLLYTILYSIDNEKKKDNELIKSHANNQIQHTLNIIRTLDIYRLSYLQGLASDTLYEMVRYSRDKLKDQIYYIEELNDLDKEVINNTIKNIVFFERITSAYERYIEEEKEENEDETNLKLFINLCSGGYDEVRKMKTLLEARISKLKEKITLIDKI